jgi:ribose transport system ATP-binding protein
LRDGYNAGQLQRQQISHDALVRLMVGRELKQFFHRSHAPPEAEGRSVRPVVRGEGLRFSAQAAEAVDLEIYPGEIVGLAGLMGSGRTELAEALFGLRPLRQGRVTVDGRPLRLNSPGAAIAAGIFLVPEDRRLQGLVLPASVRDNISLANLEQLSRLSIVAPRRERNLANRMCQQLGIRTPSIRQPAELLSGGNQQKVVLAKWLCRTPRLLILDEPTRGIDVGAKAEIYALIDSLASRGVAILMISSDLEEILGVSDRVLVMHDGRLAGELSRAELTEQAVMHLATGGKPAS